MLSLHEVSTEHGEEHWWCGRQHELVSKERFSIVIYNVNQQKKQNEVHHNIWNKHVAQATDTD